MREAYLYQWHSIDLDVKEVAHGRFQWTYFIDKHYCSQDTSTLLIDEVRANALMLAHRSIDLLNTITSNAPRLAPTGAASRPQSTGRLRDLAASASAAAPFADRPES